MPFFDAFARVSPHGAVDERRFCVGHVLDEVPSSRFEFNLVEQHELGVDIVPDVPNTVEKFSVQLTVFVAGHVDGVQQVKFVLERNGSVGHVKHGLLGHRVNRRYQRYGDVGGLGDVERQRDVGHLVGDEDRLVEVVPAVVVNVAPVVVVTHGNRPVGEIAVFIGQNHRGEFLAKVCVNKLNGLVGERLTVHVQQGVLEDGTRHGHVEIVGCVDSNLDRVRKQDFLAVVQLSNHVVGAGQQTGPVERAVLHH